MSWRCLVAGAVVGALLASVVAATIWPRQKPRPPAVATKPDTTGMVVKDGETTYTIEYRTDSAASKELTKLRDELVGRANWIEKLTGYVSEMKQENQYLADSLTRLTLDSLRGMVKIVRGPAGILVFDYKDGLVRKTSEKVWHQRFTILAGKGGDKPKVKTTGLPFDAGLFAAGGFATRINIWTPASWAWVGLSLTRQSVTAMVGPMFDGTLKLRGEVRADWRF